jgi:hypothetical protein
MHIRVSSMHARVIVTHSDERKRQRQVHLLCLLRELALRWDAISVLLSRWVMCEMGVSDLEQEEPESCCEPRNVRHRPARTH